MPVDPPRRHDAFAAAASRHDHFYGPDADELISFKQVLLQRAEWVARQYIPRWDHLLSDVRVIEQGVDNLIRVELRGFLYQTKLLEDTVTLPVSGSLRVPEGWQSVLVELPRTWWQRLLRRPPRHVWRPVVGVAHQRINGTVTVKAEYFASFPYAEIPANLGPATLAVPMSNTVEWST